MGSTLSNCMCYDHFKAYYNCANDPRHKASKGFLNRGVIDKNTSASKRQIDEQ